MKLIPTHVYKANGSRLINGYKVTLSKVEIEKAGFQSGDELTATYKPNKIVLEKKIKPST